MTAGESLFARWRRWTAGAMAMIGIALAAWWHQQPDVPVLYSPEFRYVCDTQIELTAAYAVTTSVGVVDIDAGFRSDGCSIPRRLWSTLGLSPFSGAAIRGGLGHDAMVRGELYSPQACNLLFREILLADGVQPDKAEVMYRAVELAAPDVWALHTADSINAARALVRIRE